MTTETAKREYTIHQRSTVEHPKQDLLVNSEVKRIIAKAGRRYGKTVGLSKRAVKRFLKGRRQLYAAPTNTQTDAFWFEVCASLAEPIDAGILRKNETERYIEVPGTKQRIKAKTAWNANTLRGDYADDLYLDEFQLMAEDTWDEVGAPMLIDNDGDAVFCFTPPSLASSGVSKAKDPRHASKFYRDHDGQDGWLCIHATSYDNPYISRAGLDEVARDMSLEAHRREILAEDEDIELSWLVYSKFDEVLCKVQRLLIPSHWPTYSGHDFGSANPGALFIAQNPGPEEPRLSSGAQIRKGDFVVWREYAPGSGHSTFEHVQEFKSLSAGRNVLRSVGGNLNTEDEIRQGYTAHGWPIQPPKIGRVNAQIDRVIGLMELNKVFVFEDCHRLLGELSNCLWELDNEGKITNKIQNEARFHLLASLRYILSDFMPETVATNEQQVWGEETWM